MTCQAGQYCVDPVLADCQNGCLNDNNCLSNQTCAKDAGDNEGTCQNKAADPDPGNGDGPTQEEFCAKWAACGGPAAECAQAYAAINASCRSCLVDANCNDENACEAECGMGGDGDGDAGGDGGDGGDDCPDGMGADCTIFCEDGLTCAEREEGGNICTKQCGNDLDCMDYSECGGISTWTCSDQGACTPF